MMDVKGRQRAKILMMEGTKVELRKDIKKLKTFSLYIKMTYTWKNKFRIANPNRGKKIISFNSISTYNISIFFF